MSRWEPNARGRLEAAAMALFAEHGFEQVTVAEIAGRAGLTERTFYRHFADKREVLFPDTNPLAKRFAAALADASQGAPPMAVVADVLEDVAAYFRDRRAYSRQRRAVITANTELQERELVKLAALTAVLAEGLRGRGVGEPASSLAAEAGIAVFKIGVAQWVADGEERDLRAILREALGELKAVTSEGGKP